MRTYKLYGTSATAADNLANVLIARNGRIKSIRWEVHCDQVADNSLYVAELSLRSANQATTNDSVGDISVLRQFGSVLTSGVFAGRQWKQELVDIPVAQSERVYLHLVTATTTTATLTVYIDVAES